jgi:hypothetical protein
MIMDKKAAIKEIKNIFAGYKALTPKDSKVLKVLTDGKLYELFVLAHLIESLRMRGFTLAFKGTTLKFKASPGQIKTSDPHFEINAPDGSLLWLFVDIEFETLGSGAVGGAHDRSRRHEVDIVIVTVTKGYPLHDQIALGVECKAVANFSKSIVKEVLGVRRELSYFRDAQPSILSTLGGVPSVSLRAEPASEFWLAYTDAKGDQYSESPAAFGIEFKHLQP